MFDLGSLLSPQAQNSTSDTQPATTKDQWDAYLANPATRAALLSTGLSLMAGGWGSPIQQIAQGVGAGVESGANVGANMQKHTDMLDAVDRQQQRFSQEDQLKREELANRKDIANIYANTRLTTAGMRLQPKTGAETAAYNRTFNATATSLRQSLPYIQGQLTEDQVIEQARNAAENAISGARAIGAGQVPGNANAGDLAAPGGGTLPAGTNTPGNLPGASASQTQSPVQRARDPKTGQVIVKKNGIWYDEKTGQPYGG